MATAKSTPAKTDTLTGELVDGIYTEKVELSNGTKVDVEVITDPKKLPATYYNLLAEGNTVAMVIAALTTKTRRLLDFSGAILEDLEDIISPVIDRARDAAEKAEEGK